MNHMKTQKRKAFTLIELLVVTTITAILVSVGAISYSSATRKSKDTKRRSDVEQIRSALEMYRADNGGYIVGDGNASTQLQMLVDGGYISKVPKDPINKEYRYKGTNCSATVCYGYTVQANLETYGEGVYPTENTCLGDNGNNYCLKNP
jgi:general secretion pathway protein G